MHTIHGSAGVLGTILLSFGVALASPAAVEPAQPEPQTLPWKIGTPATPIGDDLAEIDLGEAQIYLDHAGADANDAVARALCERDCAAALEVATQAGVEKADLRLPPVRGDRHSAAYCPVCLAEYRAGFDRCADCHVPLVAYGA